MFRYESRAYNNGATTVAGVDEAGRGPMAGPVVAAAVVLPRTFRHPTLTDSKQLSKTLRNEIYVELTQDQQIDWAVGISSVETIDRDNVLVATHSAMQSAITSLKRLPDHVLIDGLLVRSITINQTAIVKGDSKSFSIAAASVIAKVTRDRMMVNLHNDYPQYNFAQHKGYPTAQHFAALSTYGPCPIHRKSFAPVRNALEMVQKEFDSIRTAS